MQVFINLIFKFQYKYIDQTRLKSSVTIYLLVSYVSSVSFDKSTSSLGSIGSLVSLVSLDSGTIIQFRSLVDRTFNRPLNSGLRSPQAIALRA